MEGDSKNYDYRVTIPIALIAITQFLLIYLWPHLCTCTGPQLLRLPPFRIDISKDWCQELSARLFGLSIRFVLLTIIFSVRSGIRARLQCDIFSLGMIILEMIFLMEKKDLESVNEIENFELSEFINERRNSFYDS